MSLADRVAKRPKRRQRHPSGVRHKLSQDGTHKWETAASLARYRLARDKRNLAAFLSRQRNRP